MRRCFAAVVAAPGPDAVASLEICGCRVVMRRWPRHRGDDSSRRSFRESSHGVRVGRSRQGSWQRRRKPRSTARTACSRDRNALAFVPFRDELEEYGCFRLVAAHIANVVEDEQVERSSFCNSCGRRRSRRAAIACSNGAPSNAMPAAIVERAN